MAIDKKTINPSSLRSEVIRLRRNSCPVCRGIADQFAVDWVSSLSGIRKLQPPNERCVSLLWAEKIICF